MVKYSQAMEYDCTGCLLNILSAFSVQMRGTCVYKEMVPLQSKEDPCLILSLTSAAEEIPYCLLSLLNICGVSENVFYLLYCCFSLHLFLCVTLYHLSPVKFLCSLYNLTINDVLFLTVKSRKSD